MWKLHWALPSTKFNIGSIWSPFLHLLTILFEQIWCCTEYTWAWPWKFLVATKHSNSLRYVNSEKDGILPLEFARKDQKLSAHTYNSMTLLTLSLSIEPYPVNLGLAISCVVLFILNLRAVYLERDSELFTVLLLQF